MKGSVTTPASPSDPRPPHASRRVFLALGATAVASVAAAIPLLRRWRGRQLAQQHVNGPADPSLPARDVTRTVAHFTGALFGHTLTADDEAELVDRLDFAQRADAGWRNDFAALARYVDRLARHEGAASFAVVTADQRERVLARIMTAPVDDGRSGRLALLSEDERDRRRARTDTIAFLGGLYRRSGVPWRVRGYTHWIGIPGDAREYTRPGMETPC
jgi:hypothetical protein